MTKAAADLATLLADPAWLAHRYDPVHDAVHFSKVDRAAHRTATFITDDYLPKGRRDLIVAREAAIAAAPSPAPIHFLFHSAFCCSTLVARALDVPGVALALKEPVILNDITGWRHHGSTRGGEAKGSDVARALDHALRLLARPFSSAEAIIVKPSNVVNGLAPVMLSLRPEAHAVFIYAPLPIFLRSIAKKGIDGRLWVRDLLAKLLREGLIDLGFEGEDYLRLTDLQAAAVGWLAQHALFARLTLQFGARIRTLDSEVLLARPTAAMTAMAGLFALPLDATAITSIVTGPAFTRHSKTEDAFDTVARGAEYNAAHAAHRDEIDKVVIWANAVADAAGIAMAAPQPLLSARDIAR